MFPSLCAYSRSGCIRRRRQIRMNLSALAAHDDCHMTYYAKPLVRLQHTACLDLLPTFKLHATTNILGFHTVQRQCQIRFVASQSSKKDDFQDDNKPDMWTQIRSIPNMITLGRMASTPLLCYWIVQEHYSLAISGCILAAMSDGLDGYIAKHHGGGTVLGTYLDPIADKVLINGLAVSLWYSGILPTPLTLLWATKDVLLLSGTAWYLYQQHQTINILSNSIATKPLTVTPSLLGKVNTGLQFATLWAGILTPVTTMHPMLLPSLCWVTGLTTVGSVLSYTGGDGIQMFKERKKRNEKAEMQAGTTKEKR